MADGRPDVSLATSWIRERLGVEHPEAAIVLGSGLGGLADHIEEATRVPYGEVPGFIQPRVEGHAGALVRGKLAGREVLALSGRFHVYEGHDIEHTAFPVRVAASLGAPILVVSNASGGIRRTFRAGDLMVITDHVNLMSRNPLVGAVVNGETRFPDMSEPYDPELRARLHEIARTLGIVLQVGVYGALLGPTYETPAEVRMLERLGIDAVGMSTVPEVLPARAARMRVVGVSCVTNVAAGLSPFPVDHADVLASAARAAVDFERLITEFVRTLP
jgi:purine-nucleoside phosphorylase